jgi:hypothetical protein
LEKFALLCIPQWWAGTAGGGGWKLSCRRVRGGWWRLSPECATDGEIVWAILPTIIFIIITLPSVCTLHITEEINNSTLTVKRIGHQWYQNYKYINYKDLTFNSYVIPTPDVKPSVRMAPGWQ